MLSYFTYIIYIYLHILYIYIYYFQFTYIISNSQNNMKNRCYQIHFIDDKIEARRGQALHSKVPLLQLACHTLVLSQGFPAGSDGKESACNAEIQVLSPQSFHSLHYVSNQLQLMLGFITLHLLVQHHQKYEISTQKQEWWNINLSTENTSPYNFNNFM